MPEVAPSNKPIKKRRGRWWRWPLYALLVLAVAFSIFRYTVHRRVVNQINAIRDAGYPVTLEELDAWYEMPEGKNAADVYLRAFAAFPTDRITKGIPVVGTVEGYELGQPLNEEMASRIEAYLVEHTVAISLLEEAALIETCRLLRSTSVIGLTLANA